MFKQKVDDDINLVFLEDSLAQTFLNLRNENLNYLSKFMPWASVDNTEESYEKWIKNSLIEYADGKASLLAIEYQGEIIGSSGFHNINLNLKKLEIGYWIAEKHQKKGIVTRVCRFLIDYAFTHYDIDKIEIWTVNSNTPSRSVCERLGMNLEGIISHSENIHGKLVSHAVYGLHRKK